MTKAHYITIFIVLFILTIVGIAYYKNRQFMKATPKVDGDPRHEQKTTYETGNNTTSGAQGQANTNFKQG